MTKVQFDRSFTPLKSVAVYLRGISLDPARVSEALGIEPSRAQKTGGVRAGSRRFIAKTGMWALVIESDTRPLSDMIDELLFKVSGPALKLNGIQGVEDAHLDILYAFGSDCLRGALELSFTPEQTVKLAGLGLGVSITIM